MIVKTVTTSFKSLLHCRCGFADLPSRIVRIIRPWPDHALPVQFLEFVNRGVCWNNQGKQQAGGNQRFHALRYRQNNFASQGASHA
jgi:hypothetical protein